MIGFFVKKSVVQPATSFVTNEDDYFAFLYLAPNSQQPNTQSQAETVLDHVSSVLDKISYVSRLRACGPVIPGIPRFGRSGSGWVRVGSLWQPGPLR